MASEVAGPWGTCSKELDRVSDDGALGRGQGESNGVRGQYSGNPAQETQQGSSAQTNPGGVCPGLGTGSEPQPDDRSNHVHGNQVGDRATRTIRRGPSGFRDAWGQIVSGHLRPSEVLCHMGDPDRHGGPGSQLASEEVGSLVATAEAHVQDRQGCQAEHAEGEHVVSGQLFQLHHGGPELSGPASGTAARGGTDEGNSCAEDGGGGPDRSRASTGEDRDRCQCFAAQDTPGDVIDPEDGQPDQDLSEKDAMNLAREWHLHRNPFSKTWEDLVGHGRPFLVELACFHDSLLSAEVEKRFGKGSAVRLSEWNGANLETAEGVQYAIQRVKLLKPKHLWIACECSPYCPLQHLNKGTPERKAKLDQKQERARNQYSGAIEVARAAWKQGTEVHWEFAQRCEAWKLPMIESYIQEFSLKKVSCNGCAVGLRTRDGKLALCKAWTIASRNQHLLRHLDLRCQGNHPKGKCERGEAAHTSRYTVPFARKVIDSLSECEPWHRIVEQQHQALHTDLEEAQVGEDVNLEISPEERLEIEKKIQHIHQTTGHGSMKNLIHTLTQRGVQPKVIQVAKEWTCSICAHRKRTDPRRFAQLETIPQKWERLQIDMATWVHPKTKAKYHFVVAVDEGTRFRMARLTTMSSGNTTNWKMIQRALEEGWFATFGAPRVLRTDAAGPCNPDEADQYFSERGIEFVTIPAEAHWQIGIVEGSIKSLKGMLERFVQEFPDKDIHELLARAVWVCNCEERYKGFSPMQQVLGRGPDEHGHMFEDDRVRPVGPELLDDGGFQEDVKIRCAATKAFAEEQARRKLEKAQRMGRRSLQDFLPGDVVYYWRRQVPLKEKTTHNQGRFIGPARVLATETRRDSEGEWRPGSVVWLHRGGRLLKCAPEQLRKASPYELQIESLTGPIEIPWMITTLATDPKRRTYVDLSMDKPNREEWTEAHEEPPVRTHHGENIPETRMRKKGTVESRHAKRGSEEAALPDEHDPRPPPSRSAPSVPLEVDDEDLHVSQEALAAVEISMLLPSSRRGTKKFLANPEAYMSSQIRRK